MFAAAPSRTLALDAVAAEKLAMDMEVRISSAPRYKPCHVVHLHHGRHPQVCVTQGADARSTRGQMQSSSPFAAIT